MAGQAREGSTEKPARERDPRRKRVRRTARTPKQGPKVNLKFRFRYLTVFAPLSIR